MQPVPTPDSQHEITPKGWNVPLTILVYNGRAWFTMRQLCAAVGISGVKRQYDALVADGRFEGMLMELNVKTKAGMRPMSCIARQGVGGWLNHISHKRVRDEAAPNLLRLQLILLQAADQVIFGDGAGALMFLPPADPSLPSPPPYQQVVDDVEALKHYALSLENVLGDIYKRIRRLESPDEDESDDEEGQE